ncbi:methyltransferase domain-containing protein [soil metagenome]
MIEEFEEALAAARGLLPTPNAVARLVNRFGVEAAREAFEQWELRSRARAKFARAEEMLFVREALEQATHESVAAYHASLFPVGAPVVDMTAGIGADLIALATRGPTIGYELDPQRAECAVWNLRAHGLSAPVRVEDSLEAELGVYAFADPSRRSGGVRTHDLRQFSPDPFVLAERFGGLKLGVMKLGPGTSDADLERIAPRIEFVSFGGECREALAIVGGEPWRGAVRVETGSRLASGPSAHEDEPLDWLFDPDPAVVRAGATGTLALQHGLTGLGGYLSGPSKVDSCWLRPYRILWTGRPDRSDLDKALRALGGRVFEAKSRADGSEAQRLMRRLRPQGDRLLSLATWRTGPRVVAALLESS